MKAINLKTEYLINPIGIDIEHPRLFWNCDIGVKQTAYRIVAATEGATVWDSGKVSSPSMRADYPRSLNSRQKVIWKVLLWDENDNSGDWSEEAFFEAGLLKRSDWKAQWITGNYNPRKNVRYPVDCFRKSFFAKKSFGRVYI